MISAMLEGGDRFLAEIAQSQFNFKPYGEIISASTDCFEFVVPLTKGDKGLGLEVEKTKTDAIRIKRVSGAAKECGLLQAGDMLFSANDTELQDLEFNDMYDASSIRLAYSRFQMWSHAVRSSLFFSLFQLSRVLTLAAFRDLAVCALVFALSAQLKPCCHFLYRLKLLMNVQVGETVKLHVFRTKHVNDSLSSFGMSLNFEAQSKNAQEKPMQPAAPPQLTKLPSAIFSADDTADSDPALPKAPPPIPGTAVAEEGTTAAGMYVCTCVCIVYMYVCMYVCM
jgi:hypothetical protein